MGNDINKILKRKEEGIREDLEMWRLNKAKNSFKEYIERSEILSEFLAKLQIKDSPIKNEDKTSISTEINDKIEYARKKYVQQQPHIKYDKDFYRIYRNFILAKECNYNDLEQLKENIEEKLQEEIQYNLSLYSNLSCHHENVYQYAYIWIKALPKPKSEENSVILESLKKQKIEKIEKDY